MRRYNVLPFLCLVSIITGPISSSALTNSRTAVSLSSLRKRRRPLLLQETISIRGGDAGRFKLVAQEAVAKAACVFFMAQSSTTWLAPHRTCLKYGLTTTTLNVACNRKLATAYLASAVMMYGMLFQKCTRETAVGAAAVAWMMEQLKARLYYEAEEIGRPVIGEYVVAFLATATAYATLWEHQFAPMAMKTSAALIILNGIAFFASPSGMCKFWGIPVGITAPPSNKKLYSQQRKEYNETIFLHRYMGVALVFSGIMQAVLAWDGEIYQAIGYSYACLFLVNCWSFLKTSDFKRLARSSLSVSSSFDLKKRLSKLFFPMFNAVVFSTLLLWGSPVPAPIAP